jgi:hypothetical protein
VRPCTIAVDQHSATRTVQPLAHHRNCSDIEVEPLWYRDVRWCCDEHRWFDTRCGVRRALELRRALVLRSALGETCAGVATCAGGCCRFPITHFNCNGSIADRRAKYHSECTWRNTASTKYWFCLWLDCRRASSGPTLWAFDADVSGGLSQQAAGIPIQLPKGRAVQIACRYGGEEGGAVGLQDPPLCSLHTSFVKPAGPFCRLHSLTPSAPSLTQSCGLRSAVRTGVAKQRVG